MKRMIKVAMVAVDLSRTGISTVIINYLTHMDLEHFQIDLLVGDHIVPEYRSQCEKLGVKIVCLPFKLSSTKLYYQELWKALSEEKYDIIHVHGNSAMITMELIIAYIKGIKIRIAHCHNTTCNYMMVNRILTPFFILFYTHGFACSTPAGKWMFNRRKFYIIPNGFNTEKFVFNRKNRDSVRIKLGITDDFVIGHIGQFNDQKNHRFLLRVFEKVADKHDNCRLILIGGGTDYNEISDIVSRHPYKNRIILYGESDCPEKMYSAMDCFVFPSKFEGLGIVLLEAQINGLPCVSSDVVPQEAILGDRVQLLSLNDDMEKWVEAIISAEDRDREMFYIENRKLIEMYDIKKNARKLEEYYQSFKNGEL